MSRPSPVTYPEAQAAPRLRVLLLDDSPLDAELMEARLRAAYPDVVLRAVGDRNGYEAALGAQDWDVVLVDYRVPGFSELEAVSLATAGRSLRPVLLVSGLVSEAIAREAVLLGAWDVVLKQDLDRLPRALDRALREATLRLDQHLLLSELRDSEAIHRAFFDHAPIGMVRLEADSGRFLAVNACFARMLGYAPGELLGRPVEAFTHPDDLAQTREAIRVLREGRSAHHRMTKRYLRKDGTLCWGDLSSVFIPAEDRRPAQFATVVTDITEQLEGARERDELMRQLQDLKVAIDTAAIVATTDAEGRITSVNDRFLQETGYEREELLGRSHRFLKSGVHPPAFYRTLWNTITSGRPWRDQLCNRAKDGSLYWSDTTIVPFLDPDGRPYQYMAIRFDITETHRLQEQLHQSQKLESLGTLVGGIAHDFNNLLMAILGYVEVLQELDPPAADRARALQTIHRAALRGRTLVSELMNFGRMNPPMRTPTPPNQVLEEVHDLLDHAMPPGILLKLDLAPGLPSVLLDPNQVHQVVMNLAINARDAITGEGLVVLRSGSEVLAAKEADVLGKRPGAYVFLEVEDTGCGMPPEVEARIFEPFYTTKEVGKGTGLGLSVVHGIAESHGGLLRCDSEVGRGTRMRILLPVAGTPHAGTEPHPARGAPIAILDAPSGERDALCGLLEGLGHMPVPFDDRGALHQAQIAGTAFRLMIVHPDALPEGPSALPEPQAGDAAAPVVVASGDFATHKDLRSRAQRSIHVINFPYRPHELINALGRLLP